MAPHLGLPIMIQPLSFLALEAEKLRKPLLTQISKGQVPLRDLAQVF